MSGTQVTVKKKLSVKSDIGAISSDDKSKGSAKKGASAAAQGPILAGPSGIGGAEPDKLSVIVCVIIGLVFLGLLGMQALEWFFYSQPPSAWVSGGSDYSSSSRTKTRTSAVTAPESDAEEDIIDEEAGELIDEETSE